MSQARIEVDIDTGNTSMQDDEEQFIYYSIKKLIEDRGMTVKDIKIHR